MAMRGSVCWCAPARRGVAPNRRPGLVALACAATTLATCGLAAEPYVPRDDEVLESLPTSLFASRDEATALREQLAGNPADLQTSVSVATRYMQLGNQSGDPRFYGYARGALKPWWQATGAPSDVLRLRSKLHEKNHDYDLALADLRLLLASEPRDIQAWIETSNILRVQGEYRQANAACDKLRGFAGPFATSLAQIPIMVVTGEAEEACRELERQLPQARHEYPSTVQWFLTMQAETALALGNAEEAEAHLREALAAAPKDRYLLRAYSELLLDRNRAEEALTLAAGYPNDDGLLLCTAIAARRLGREAQASEFRSLLAARFDEVRQRGDQPLGRFEARFELEVNGNASRALELALENWRLQKETHDTQVVLEAALATGDTERVKPVLDFLAENRTEHAALRALVKQLSQR